MERYEMTPSAPPVAGAYETADRVSAFLRAVYGWMCAGLAITAVTTPAIASSPGLVVGIGSNRLLFLCPVIVPFGVAWVLSARGPRIAASTSSMVLLGDSIL